MTNDLLLMIFIILLDRRNRLNTLYYTNKRTPGCILSDLTEFYIYNSLALRLIYSKIVKCVSKDARITHLKIDVLVMYRAVMNELERSSVA